MAYYLKPGILSLFIFKKNFSLLQILSFVIATYAKILTIPSHILVILCQCGVRIENIACLRYIYYTSLA